jgi:nitroreductase
MSGIVFHKTTDRRRIADFYVESIGMEIWLEEADCTLLRHGNLILGFHEQPEADTGGLITFVLPDRTGVDAAHSRLGSHARGGPRSDERYRIYHFFATDPEGRALEIQSFDRAIPPILDGVELLSTRRSVREYREGPVDPGTLAAILDLARLAPSARNTQPWSFVVARDPQRLARLAAVRGDSSAPLSRAPTAVAVTADPALTPCPVEDACIAAYHLLLAARLHGLGTCWIGRMDRDDVKEILGIPSGHYVATVTPLGYPAETPLMRERGAVRVREV